MIVNYHVRRAAKTLVTSHLDIRDFDDVDSSGVGFFLELGVAPFISPRYLLAGSGRESFCKVFTLYTA